jgi:hypothetical protein
VPIVVVVSDIFFPPGSSVVRGQSTRVDASPNACFPPGRSVSRVQEYHKC